MNYAVTFSILAACLIGIALQGGVCWFALWPGISSIILTAAYAKLGPVVLGKQADGTLAWWAWVLLLPYFLLSWLTWHLLRVVRREDCCNEVVPGLWLGRRILAHEVPNGVDLIVDLTAEFCEARQITGHKTYVCLPVLDASVPDCAPFAAVVEQIAAWPGSVYIHCASGHGRSPTMMAAVLVKKRLVENVGKALKLIKKARPGIALNKQQRRLLDKWSQQPPMIDSAANADRSLSS